MSDDSRVLEAQVHEAQVRIREVANVLAGQRAGLDEAAGLVDADVPEAMITWEVCPTLAHALHGRLATAREELEELLRTLDDAATLRREDVERRFRDLQRRLG